MRSFRSSYTVRLSIVYSPSWGKCLTGPVVGAQKEGGKATPLVDATIEFLKEFQPVPAHSKWKVKEVDREDEDGFEYFIPTYVYDVMKAI